MKKMFTGVAAGLLAISIAAGSASAEVQFDSELGTGFVGKGDVQQALGWNNAQLQKEADSLKFTSEVTEVYEVTVEWTTGEGTKGEKIHTVEHKKTTSVSSSLNSEARKANQFTGFLLNGFKESQGTGSVPDVGDEFPGNSGHIVTEVKLVAENQSLYVNVNGVKVLLP